MADFDVAIIGGGINGAAIARDAAGRGLRTLLIEQNDLGSGTSCTSTKLIHGGLRYLEQGAFRLVQEGLQERTLLLKMAPHLIWPARFVLPHHKGLRPAWQLRIGLFIYDWLAGENILPGTQRVDLTKDETGEALLPRFKVGFEYSDCCVDDVRLVVMNAVDAAEKGASIRTRTRFEQAVREEGHWRLTLKTKEQRQKVTTRVLINASGPWIEGVNEAMPLDTPRSRVKLVKGSHIVVRKLFTHDKAYIFQNADGRIVFAIPYEQDFTLIGTTEYNVSGDPAEATASDEEISYLCHLAGEYFRKSISAKDVVWSFAGVRALYDSRTLESKDLSRDYFLELDGDKEKAPLLSIYGGKLTAARHLAELALDKLKPFVSMKDGWTATEALPGGDFPWDGFEALVQNVRAKWPFLTEAHAKRLARAYGTRIDKVLGKAMRMEDLGTHFGAGLMESEVRYLTQHEWAQTTDDILWRRSKLGLHMTTQEQGALAHFMEKRA
jgi:glycerol-3-phosphate dehydrogenase